MEIIVPVDVKYKGVLHKAHTPFFCDSPSYEKFKLLGAWAFRKADEETPAPTKSKRKI